MGSGATSDALGGVSMAAGIGASLLGAPEIGIPLMLGGGGALIGGNVGGYKGMALGGASGAAAGLGGEGLAGMGPLSGLLGGGGGGLGSMLGMGGPAGAAGQTALQAPSAMGDVMQSVNPAMAPPPQTLTAAGTTVPGAVSGDLSPGTPGPVPTDPTTGAAATTAQGQPPQKPWYKDPAYWQGAGTVGAEYLKFLSSADKTEFAHPFSSTVVPQTGQLAALGQRGPVPPIQPPQLNI